MVVKELMKKEKNEKLSNSMIITLFLNFIDNVQKYKPIYTDLLEQEDKLCQDLLHTLELQDMSYTERAKIATKLSTNRKDRRFYKDTCQIMEDISIWLCNNKKAVEELKQVLGKVRKIEKYQKDRQYIPKTVKNIQDLYKGEDNNEEKK